MRRLRLNVRTRLTLWSVIVLAVLVAAFSGGVYLYVRESLYSQLDNRLADNISVISETLRTDSGELSEIERHTVVIAFRVIENNWPVYVSGGWLAADLDAAGRTPEHDRWIYASPRGGIFHIKETGLTVGDRKLTVTTAEQGEQIHRSLKRLGLTMLGGYPVMLLLSLFGGYFLAGRALNPLQNITERARTIEAENLSQRLVVANPDDELGQLSIVLNDTFARLEEAFGRLKRFTQDAAHELRTPLAVMRSVGEVGLQTQREPESYRDIIGSMLEEVDRLEQLVDGLLTLTRAESGRFMVLRQPADLHTFCLETVECLRVLAEEKQQTLQFESSIETPVLFDRDTLRLALVNLIANAIRFTPVRGEVRVNLRRPENNSITIEVIDNGPGIASEHHARIFERFYRVDKSRANDSGGTGLGLAIARWAVEANSGCIQLESEPGKGSCFRIVLPDSDNLA